MISRYKKMKSFVTWSTLFVILSITSAATADVDIFIDLSHPSPQTMNPGDRPFLRVDVTFSESDFDTLFLVIPDQPGFFDHWSNKRIAGPGNYIYDKIDFKPELDDGGQYFFDIIAGGIRADGTVVADTVTYEVRVTSFILQEPEFTGGTSNTITWHRNTQLFDQFVFLVDPTNPAGFSKGMPSLGKGAASEFRTTTFENLQHEVRYGYFVKGFTEDSVEVHSDTVFSTQDAVPPEFLDTSMGMEGPDGTVDLFWTAINDQTSSVIGYVIFRRSDSNAFTAIDTVFAKTGAPDESFHFKDKRWRGLVEGETYFYKVGGMDEGFNVGDGMMLGPFVPDSTRPAPPTFQWEVGFGFDFLPPPPHAPFREQSDEELPWYKQGTSNTVYVMNPENLSGFEGLASADSVRFQAVRDRSIFFEREWQPGLQFFDSWMSPWIPIDQFVGDFPSYMFDFTNGGQNDEWFIHGHFFKYRAQFKDKAKNLSDWSRFNEDGRFVAAFQDVFAPGDISNLNIFVEFDASFSGGGFLRLDWQAALDSVSGVQLYNVYRKIGPDGMFELAGTAPHVDGPVIQFRDAFGNIDKSTQIFYRVAAMDNVGNLRDFTLSNWEVSTRAPIPPIIAFAEDLTVIDDKFYTNRDSTTISWEDFDLDDIAEMFLTVNGMEISVDPNANQALVPLREGPNEIFAHVVFIDGIRSANSNVLMVIKDSTPPAKIANLTVENDTSFTGNMFLNWTASSDLLQVDYSIFRRELGSGNFEMIGNTLELSFTDPYMNPNGTVLKAFQHYEYKVLPSDQLGNSSDTSAAIDENYCNIAPAIQSIALENDSVVIDWSFPAFPEASAVRLDQIRFDVKLFQDVLPDDFDNTPAFRSEFVVADTTVSFKIIPGPKFYAVVRGIELASSNLDSTAWSEPRLTDTGQSIIPPNVNLETQAQPTDTTGIFVVWEDYFEQDPAFWAANSPEIVGFYRVRRWLASSPMDVLERDFGPQNPAYINRMFMDRESLIANENYVYQVIPFEVKTNDPPRFLPAGNDAANNLNAVSMVTNYTDRVFIPKFNGLHPVNPATGKKYFNLVDSDSLQMNWFWLYLENGMERVADPGDFRGADKLDVFVSNNIDFLNRPDFKQFTRMIQVDRNLLTSGEDFNNIFVDNLTDPNTFNIFEGKSIFAKIMGFDKWGNSPTYPSSADFDGINEFILDNTPPTPTSLSFRIASSTDTTSNLTLVDITFSWQKSVDLLSGLRDYSIEIFQMADGKDSVITAIENIPASDTTFTLNKFEIREEYFEQPLFFRITPRDYADNQNRNGDVVEFEFFSPPDLLSVERDSITNNVVARWTKVQAADRYLIVFANQKSFFLDPGLRNNPGNREVVEAVVSDPDTITRVIARIFNPEQDWYFRMIAIRNNIFESGWSNFVLLPRSEQGGGGGNVTSAEDMFLTPTSFALKQNYPNPFNPETRISYELPLRTQVEITIYNMAGVKVRTLVNAEHHAGYHEVVWDGRNSSGQSVASGIYMYMIATPEFKQVRKCLLLK